PGHRDGREQTAVVPHGSTHRGHALLALLDALGPAALEGSRVFAEDLACGADRQREDSADGDDGAQTVRGFEGLDAQSLVAPPDVELHALARRVPQGLEGGTGNGGQPRL